jgi:GcrA cell cycle regulator
MTPAEVELQNEAIRSMCARGLSYNDIALSLGLTKNAVVGRAHRLGLCNAGVPRTNWTATMDAHLRARWADPRASIRRIAKEIGISHTALTLRASRLGLPPRKQGGGNRFASSPSPPRPKKTFSFGWQKSVPADLPRPRLPECIEVTPASITSLFNLKPRMCRWPIGHPGTFGFGFCGARTTSVVDVYCPAHTARAFV